MKKMTLIIATLILAISFTFPSVSCAKSVTNWTLVKYFCKDYYKGYKIVKVNFDDKRLQKRTGKRVIYVEKVVSISNGKGGGKIKGKWYIAYNKKVKKGKKVVSYCIYNPKTNYCDDVIAVVDNKMIR